MLSAKQKTLLVLAGGFFLGAILTSGVFSLKVANLEASSGSSKNDQNLFIVDGQTYTSAQLPSEAAQASFALEDKIYNARKSVDSEIALRIALAKDAGIEVKKSTPLPSVADLLHIPAVSEAQAKDYYNQVVAKMGVGVFGGQAFETIKTELIAQMQNQQTSQAVKTKLQTFVSAKRIVFLLQPPQAPEIALDTSAYPVHGNEKSVTTFVEVGDYMCPHCREDAAIVDKIYTDMSSKVRFVYVPFPLAPNGLSGTLARGGYCAWKQDKAGYWKYHQHASQIAWDKMHGDATAFQTIVEETAKSAGLNGELFKACLTSKEASDFIEKTRMTFTKIPGFDGTPVFFVNGRMVSNDSDTLDSALRAQLARP